MTEEERIHRELLDAFYQYIKHNLRYEQRRSSVSIVDIRRELFRIRNLAKERGKLLIEIKNEKEAKSKLNRQNDNDTN